MNSIKYLALLLLILVACKKEDIKEELLQNKAYSNGILVLNEGLFHQNNSSLSWVDLSNDEVTKGVFLKINGRPLGDTGNDMLRYGNKIYIVVNGSSTVEVIDATTFKSIQQIQLQYNGQAQQPRNIAAFGGRVYVSSFDGYVNVIDTISNAVVHRIKVGRNPEGVCVYAGNLYVSNSGGLDPSNYETTVIEIDLDSYNVIDTFDVGQNPGEIVADDFGRLYVVKRGDYGADPSELVEIDVTTDQVTNLHIPATTISISNNTLYISYYNYNTSSSQVGVFDCVSQTLTNANFISDQSVTTLYGAFVYQNDGLICIDAMNFTNSGYLRFYNASGQNTKSINVGLNPNSFIILN